MSHSVACVAVMGKSVLQSLYLELVGDGGNTPIRSRAVRKGSLFDGGRYDLTMPKRKKKVMNFMVSGKAINGGLLIMNFVSERPGRL